MFAWTSPYLLPFEITLLLLEQEPESYVPAARRLLGRFASERAMPLRQLADVAAILAELEADPATSARPKRSGLIRLTAAGSESDARRLPANRRFAWKAVPERASLALQRCQARREPAH